MRPIESPNGATSRRSSAANRHGQEGIIPSSDALVHEKSVTEGDMTNQESFVFFPDFGPQDSSKQEQIPLPPSPAVTVRAQEVVVVMRW